MKLVDLEIEYRNNPVGLDISKPRFSWKMISGDQNILQTAYQITIHNEGNVVWNSTRIESSSSVLIEYGGPKLEACTQYQVVVEAWDNRNRQATVKGGFETGLLNGANFSAAWITHELPEEETACPVFTKEFQTAKDIEKVRIYATALGVYEIKMNGRKVGDSFFAPGWTNYKKRLQYQTYITDQMVTEKSNRIEITVGNGWYKGIIGFNPKGNNYGDRVAVLAEIHITYTDGTTELIITDPTWEVTTGCIRSSEIYMGETIDSCFTEKEVSRAVAFSYDTARIVTQECEPVQIIQRLPATESFTTPKGEKVIDFGQNLTGFVELKVMGQKGQKITVRHAETLDKHGNFYTENLRHAKAVDQYICNGEMQTFLPTFTFHGFRYIAIEGLEEIHMENFEACVLYTQMEPTITFKTSNALVNQLYSNVLWGQRGNFLDIPSDCPQRDERLGYTGDAQVFAGTAAYNYNVALFFTKWLRDLASEQSVEYGVPHIVPNIFPAIEGAAAWSDAAVIIPWTIYQIYGDIRVLEEQYESMRDWVDFITARCNNNGLWQFGFQYGDWLALDGERGSNSRFGGTDKYLVANAYYAFSTEILAKTAAILNKADEQVKYEKLYRSIRAAFNKEYITDSGRVVSSTQTACVLALHFNLAENRHRKRIAEYLQSSIYDHNNQLTTGFVGTPYLCQVLSDHNFHDLAGKLFLREDCPSWLYPVKKGATTIWERWNSILPDGDFDSSGMNSLNHYAFGAIAEWMYRKLAGINQLEPGFKKILIKPQFVKGINSVDAVFTSVYGDIRSFSSYKGSNVKVEIEIPANTTAVLELPGYSQQSMEVGSGTFHFEYIAVIDYDSMLFSMGTTLKELLDQPLAIEMLKRDAPGFLNSPFLNPGYDMPVSKYIADFPGVPGRTLKSVIAALNR